jgi:2-phospho-L-lactate guanylyltransferase
MPVPLVPVKALAEAKGRLAPEVGPLQRRLLAIAMFEDVSPPSRRCRRSSARWSSPPTGGLAAGRRHGLPGGRGAAGAGDLNAALAAAAAAGDGSPLLVVAADLPLASAAGLERVLAAAGAPVAVVPSADGGGTNVLAWRDPASFAPSFGPDSAARHLAVPGAVRVDDPGPVAGRRHRRRPPRGGRAPRPVVGHGPPAQGPRYAARLTGSTEEA